MQELNRKAQLRYGLIGGAVLALVLIAIGVIYVLPLGKATYAADMSETGSIKAGDDVRIAGVPVGKVTALKLQSDRVTMTFTVERDIFIGDATTLDIKMLTAAGGHFVAVSPAGTNPLGSKPIPTDHVKLPYSLGRAFQDASKPIAEVDGNTLRKNFATLEASLAGNPDGLRQIGNAMDSFVDLLDRQNKDVSAALAVADEYLRTVDGAKSLIGELITKLNTLETSMGDKRDEIRESLALVARLLSRIAAIEPSWHTRLEPLVQKLADAIPQLQRAAQRLDGVIASVHEVGRKVQQMTSPGGVVLDQSSGLCIPLPGKVC